MNDPSLPMMEDLNWTVESLVKRPKRIFRCTLGPEAQLKLVRSMHPESLRNLAGADYLTVETQKALLERCGMVAGLSNELACNPCTDPMILTRLAGVGFAVQQQVAANPSTPLHVLQGLLASDNSKVLMRLAEREDLSESFQDALANSSDSFVQASLLQNKTLVPLLAKPLVERLADEWPYRLASVASCGYKLAQWVEDALLDWALPPLVKIHAEMHGGVDEELEMRAEAGAEYNTAECLATDSFSAATQLRLSLTEIPELLDKLLDNDNLIVDWEMPAGFVMKAHETLAALASLEEALEDAKVDVETFMTLSERWPGSFKALTEACVLVTR